MAQAVSRHNSSLLRTEGLQDGQPGCNCQGGPQTCPVGGRCQTSCVVYEATVTEDTSGRKETYTGVTSRPFKKRYYEHNTDMRKVNGRTKTALSSHIWSLKDNDTSYQIKWRLKDRATAYNPTTKKCRICLKEKYHILYKSEGASLNKRLEIFNSCRHRNQKLLGNTKT